VFAYSYFVVAATCSLLQKAALALQQLYFIVTDSCLPFRAAAQMPRNFTMEGELLVVCFVYMLIADIDTH